MAKQDRLKDPVPSSGVSKGSVDVVVTALHAGGTLVSLLSGLLAAVLILYSGYVLYDSLATEYNAYSSAWDLLKYKPEVTGEEPTEGAKMLASINKDYRAWVTVYDTPIDYPVVQGENDLYYASHDIYRNSSLTGAIYLAAGNKKDLSDSYNLLYGHHMDNGAMFGSLDRFVDPAYFDAHRLGVLVTEKEVYDMELFAVVRTDAYEHQIYTVGNRLSKVLAFLTGDRSGDVGLGTTVLRYDANTVQGAVKIIALSTCADAETNGRLVVFGVLRLREFEEEKEEPVKLTVRYIAEGKQVFPERAYVYEKGGQYYVVSPTMPGYRVELEIVRGTIWEDTLVIVHYVPEDYTLTIKYEYLDGSEAAPTWKQTLRMGDEYDVVSPEVEGYVALTLRIKGTNPGRDEHYVVVYIPLDEVPVRHSDISDYETPLNLDDVHVQVGICVE